MSGVFSSTPRSNPHAQGLDLEGIKAWANTLQRAFNALPPKRVKLDRESGQAPGQDGFQAGDAAAPHPAADILRAVAGRVARLDRLLAAARVEEERLATLDHSQEDLSAIVTDCTALTAYSHHAFGASFPREDSSRLDTWCLLRTLRAALLRVDAVLHEQLPDVPFPFPEAVPAIEANLRELEPLIETIARPLDRVYVPSPRVLEKEEVSLGQLILHGEADAVRNALRYAAASGLIQPAPESSPAVLAVILGREGAAASSGG